jgi:hypothetical protein
VKWLAVWLLLTGTYLLGALVSRGLAGKPWEITRETLIYAAAIPLAQVAALWLVARLRRGLHIRRERRDRREPTATPAAPRADSPDNS